MTRKTEFRPILRPLALAAASLVLAACGGGGGGGDGNGGDGGNGGTPGQATPMSISGTVVDGYIKGAAIDCLSGGTVLAATVSDNAGKFGFELPAGQRCDAIETRGGVDVGVTPDDPSDDVLRPAGVMRSPIPTGSNTVPNLVVSPLSTLVQALVAAGSTPEAAAAQVKTSLGLPPAADLLTTDPASDVTLFRAANAVAQLTAQITAALAAAGGIESPGGQQALASNAIAALAAALPNITSFDQLAPAPDRLTPNSPLLAVIEQAATAAKNSSTGDIATALANVQPATLALIAAPLAAGAAHAMLQATDIRQVVEQTGTIVEQDRTTTVVAGLSSLLGKAASADEQQAVLAALAAGLADAASGSAPTVTVTVGGGSASAPVPTGPSNYVRLAGDQVVFGNSDNTQATATLEQFGSGAGMTLSRNLAKLAFRLEHSAGGGGASGTREIPLAVEVSDATRVLQAIVDKVAITPTAGNGFSASVPAGARLYIYAKTASRETTTPIEIALDGAGLGVVSTDSSGNLTVDVERVLGMNPGSIVPGSALADLSLAGLSGGSFTVTAVIGHLRLARSISASNPNPTLATPHTITLGGGSQSVSGYGVRGTVVVGN